MAQQSRTSGGVFIAAGALGGFALGASQGEPSLGAVIGTGLGIAAATLWWLLQLRR